jgi:hypothetical protein
MSMARSNSKPTVKKSLTVQLNRTEYALTYKVSLSLRQGNWMRDSVVKDFLTTAAAAQTEEGWKEVSDCLWPVQAIVQRVIAQSCIRCTGCRLAHTMVQEALAQSTWHQSVPTKTEYFEVMNVAKFLET